MTNENKQKAIDIIAKVIGAIHKKEYKCILYYADESEAEDMDFLYQFVQGTLEMNGYDSIDEYEVPCNNDNSGFAADYDLTSESELTDMCLQMKFLYSKTGLKSIFIGIEPQ